MAVSALALDRERIGTKLYGYVLAKRYTSSVPDSNLRTAKRRPALVVQADLLGVDIPQTIVAMITSNMARADIRALLPSPNRRVYRSTGPRAVVM